MKKGFKKVEGSLLKYKIANNICIISRCSKRPRKTQRVCDRCQKRIWVAKNPLLDSYNHLKNNAKRRNVSFSITKEEFAFFCEKTKYLELKGKYKDSYTIGRIKANIGYELGNIKIETMSINSLRRNYLEYHKNKSIHSLSEAELIEYMTRKEKFEKIYYERVLNKNKPQPVITLDEDCPF